jgi:signal transduction histidine kinase
LSTKDRAGIAPEHLPHLFERFYRVDPSRARPTGGAGLGLAIASEAARLLNGRLQAESAPGQGSCFSLTVTTAAVE